MEPRFWLSLQAEYDIWMVAREFSDKNTPRIPVFHADQRFGVLRTPDVASCNVSRIDSAPSSTNTGVKSYFIDSNLEAGND